MAEILLAELDTNNSDKHALVADLLTHHQQDTLNLLSVSLPEFIEIYKSTNNIAALPSSLKTTPHRQQHPDKPYATAYTTTRTPPPTQTHTTPTPTPTSTLTNTPPCQTHHLQTPTETTHGAPPRILAGDFVTADTLLLQTSPQQYIEPH